MTPSTPADSTPGVQQPAATSPSQDSELRPLNLSSVRFARQLPKVQLSTSTRLDWSGFVLSWLVGLRLYGPVRGFVPRSVLGG